MKARWPLKQTMLIRWSAAAWRPTIKLGGAQAELPGSVRLVRALAATNERGAVDNNGAWI